MCDPRNEVAEMEMPAKQRLEICVAQETMSINKFVASGFKVSFTVTDIQIRLEMKTVRTALSKLLSEKALEPLKAGIQSGRVCASDTELGKMITIGQEHDRQCTNLQSRMKKVVDDIDAVGFLLEEEVPAIKDLEALTLDGRKELVKKWSNIEMYMKGYESAFKAFRTEWNALKGKMEKAVQVSVDRVQSLLGEEAA